MDAGIGTGTMSLSPKCREILQSQEKFFPRLVGGSCARVRVEMLELEMRDMAGQAGVCRVRREAVLTAKKKTESPLSCKKLSLPSPVDSR